MSILQQIQEKISTWEEARNKISTWQRDGKKVVFTNGCFDLLHYGHLHYLAQARDLGDFLVIGLNSADSVSRLKGPNRPIQDESTRFLQMASLACVDLVTGFEQDTPLELIEALQPDILVKGGDYTPAAIIGADVVENRGGKVVVVPFIAGYSTTAIEQKILQRK